MLYRKRLQTGKVYGTFSYIINSFRSYNYLIQFIHGALLTLGFHPFDIFLVIPISFSGFLWCLEKECLMSLMSYTDSKKDFFKLGFKHTFIFFLGHFTTSMYWLVNPILIEIKHYWFLLPFVIFFIPSLLASFYAVVSGFICSTYIFPNINQLQDDCALIKINIAILFALGFFIAELSRSYLIVPFPWNLLGYASGYSLSLMQLASVTSVYGLSLVLYFVGTIPYTKNPGAISVITLIVIVITVSGRERLNNIPQTQKKKVVSLHVIQPNTEHHYHEYTKKIQLLNKTKGIIDNLALKHTRSSNQHNLNLFILPESSIPFVISKQQDVVLSSWMSRHKSNSFIIAGVDRYDRANSVHYNSMITVNNSGFIVDSYDKMILAPFGEYIPCYGILKYVLKPIVGESYGFTPGIRDTNMQFYSDPFYGMTISLTLMPMICFESIFIGKKTNNVDLIVNITNDSWLGKSIGAYQHLAMSRMRAIEYGLPLVRSAKTGISAVFNSYGKLLQKIDLDQEGVIVIDMPEDRVETIYMKILHFFTKQ